MVPRLLRRSRRRRRSCRRRRSSSPGRRRRGRQHAGLDRQLRLVERRSPHQPRREGDLGLARARPRALGHRDLRRTTCSGTPTPAPTPRTTGPATPTRSSSTSPATYFFQCKLHAWVRGEVIVSDDPRQPATPTRARRPPLNIDLTPPTLGDVKLAKTQAARARRARRCSASISERGSLDAEYYRLNSKGQRVYNGYETGRTFIGINHLAWRRAGSTSRRGPAATSPCCGRPTKRTTPPSR